MKIRTDYDAESYELSEQQKMIFKEISKNGDLCEINKNYIQKNNITEIIIPDSVKSIGRYTFTGCSSLTSIAIADSVTCIGYHAFAGCSGLTSIVIPDSVTYIDCCAFAGCSGLTSIAIPNSVTYIGASAFTDCSGLTSVTIKGFTFNNEHKKICKIMSDISEAYYMLETKDFSVKIYTPLKNAIIIGQYLQTGDEDTEVFIKKGCLRLFKWLIDEDNSEVISKLIDTGKFATKKNIDKLIDYADEKEKTAVKDILTNFKQKII